MAKPPYRMSYRERRYLADKARREFRFREFTPSNLAMDLKREYDAIHRKAPVWELELIVYPTASYHRFELEGEALPGWIGFELTGANGKIIRPQIKRIISYIGFHFVCEYPKGGTTALSGRSWLKVTLSVEGEPCPREISCKFRRWIRQ